MSAEVQKLIQAGSPLWFRGKERNTKQKQSKNNFVFW